MAFCHNKSKIWVVYSNFLLDARLLAIGLTLVNC